MAAEVRDYELAALALYLPQYHPTPENDQWWGPGFTEWHNVVGARPQFPGHDQPVLPADLGFYDLRLAETRDAQAALAAAAGLTAFCIYHYWFEGQRPLGEVLDRIIASGSPAFPFCLCWANEPWTRSWTGRTGEILLPQEYGAEDDIAHIAWLVDVFRDRRYLCVDGRPVLAIYRASSLPDPLSTTTRWRNAARRAGFPDLYLLRIESFRDEVGDPRDLGFDAAVEFQPAWGALPRPARDLRSSRFAHRLWGGRSPATRPRRYDYRTVVETMLERPSSPYPRHPGVMPSWDNTPRRGSGSVVFEGSTPELYGEWVHHAAERARREDVPLLFVNAWNEWAEGAMLEPSSAWGRDYITATRDGLCQGAPGA